MERLDQVTNIPEWLIGVVGTYDPSPWVFICFHWIYLVSNKRIDNELNKPVPASSERLREIL